jgi:hypothetical protein
MFLSSSRLPSKRLTHLSYYYLIYRTSEPPH